MRTFLVSCLLGLVALSSGCAGPESSAQPESFKPELWPGWVDLRGGAVEPPLALLGLWRGEVGSMTMELELKSDGTYCRGQVGSFRPRESEGDSRFAYEAGAFLVREGELVFAGKEGLEGWPRIYEGIYTRTYVLRGDQLELGDAVFVAPATQHVSVLPTQATFERE